MDSCRRTSSRSRMRPKHGNGASTSACKAVRTVRGSTPAWIAAALLLASARTGLVGQVGRRVPMVTVAGCAAPTDQPGVWALGHAGPRHESANAGITRDEQDVLAAATPGDQRYLLVGVAEFVDPEMSRAIGVRGRLLPVSRVNSTGVLAGGRRVAVKGVYIAGSPERINLTSVVDLGRACDAAARRTIHVGRRLHDGAGQPRRRRLQPGMLDVSWRTAERRRGRACPDR